MPYKASEIPSGTENVPSHGQAIYRSAFNSSHASGKSEEIAHATAWSAVKRIYKKKGERWVRKTAVDGASIEWLSRDGDRTMRDKEFSAEKREKLAKSGAAMPHGGYPIEGEADLKRAIQAFGRAKNKSATKAHIKKRAAALGKTNLLPENWDGLPAWASFDSAKMWILTEDGKACPDCGGDGIDDDEDDKLCKTCGGEGYVGLPASLEDRRKPPDDEDEDDDGDDIEDGMRTRQCDSVNLIVDSGSVRKSQDGYLVASAKIARTGIQLYDGSELGRPDMGMVRVYRPPEEVFSKKAMRSLAHKPITLDHPPQMVDANNWEKYAIGHIGDEVTRDGDTVRVPMLIMDGKAISAYERDGMKQLSVGYTTELKWGKGETPNGEAYDAMQTAIRGNHLAVVPAARGGARLALGDDNRKGAKSMVTVLIDGRLVEFDSETAASHVQAHIVALQKQIDAKKKNGNGNDDDADEEQESEKKERGEKDAAFAAMKGENAVLKKQLEDALAKTDQKIIDAQVKEKIDLLVKADALMDGKGQFDGKDAAQIRREVVMAKMGDAGKDLSDAEMVGAFKYLAANVKPRTGTDRLADSLSLLNQGGGDQNDPRAIKDAAYAAYVNRLGVAWKKSASA